VLPRVRPALQGVRGGAHLPVYAQPHAAQRLLERLADAMAEYLAAQARAGAQALMLFESWAGLLAPKEFKQFALPAVRAHGRCATPRRRAPHSTT